MMNTKTSVLLYAKKSKAKSNSSILAYLKITVSGKRAEFSTVKTVDTPKWNSEIDHLKGNSEEARTIKKYFDVCYQRSLKLKEILFIG